MRVAVVGASGLIGRRLAASLRDRGDAVVAVTRRGTAGILGVDDVRWDPSEGPPPPRALEGAHALVNLAGAPFAGRWTARRKRLIRDSRVQTTRLLAEALGAPDRPRLLVNASAVGYYGTGEREVDEGSLPGDDFLARTCVAWEEAALAAEDRGARVVRLRSAVVLAREGGALPRLALPVRLLAGGPIGGGRQWLPWIHIDDEVGLIRHALDRADLSGPLNAVAPQPVRQRDFVGTLGRALRRPAVLPVPALPVRLALGGVSTLVLEGQRVAPRAALESGYRFAWPELEPALRDLLA